VTPRQPAQIAVDETHQIGPRLAVAVARRDQQLREFTRIDALDFHVVSLMALVGQFALVGYFVR